MSFPLLCWDIIEEGKTRREEFADDLSELKELLNKKHGYPLFENSLIWENKSIIVTDAAINILYATKNMFQMNGYQPSEVIGKSPRIFQGENTKINTRSEIKAAIDKAVPFVADILNYRKNGSAYMCHIEGYPVFDQHNKLVNFIALENVINK